MLSMKIIREICKEAFGKRRFPTSILIRLVKFAFWETAFPDKHIDKISEICILGNGVSRQAY